MKKTYLAPKSETLMAVLRDLCTPIVDPTDIERASTTPGFAPHRAGGAPSASHSL